MPGYEQMESLKNGGSWGKFWWKTCGCEWVKTDVYRHADNSQWARVFVDGRECTSQSAMGTVTLHHSDSSDRVYESTRVHPLLKLLIRSE